MTSSTKKSLEQQCLPQMPTSVEGQCCCIGLFKEHACICSFTVMDSRLVIEFSPRSIEEVFDIIDKVKRILPQSTFNREYTLNYSSSEFEYTISMDTALVKLS